MAQSNNKSKNITDGVNSRVVPDNDNTGLSVQTRRCLEPKSMHLVLSQFTINSLSINQLLIVLSLSCSKASINFISRLAIKRAVSSAYITTLQRVITDVRSFIKIKKSSGPKTDPCGTPNDKSMEFGGLRWALK